MSVEISELDERKQIVLVEANREDWPKIVRMRLLFIEPTDIDR